MMRVPPPILVKRLKIMWETALEPVEPDESDKGPCCVACIYMPDGRQGIVLLLFV